MNQNRKNTLLALALWATLPRQQSNPPPKRKTNTHRPAETAVCGAHVVSVIIDEADALTDKADQ